MDDLTSMRNSLEALVALIDSGKLKVDTELTITGEGLATQTTLAAIATDIALVKADLAAIRAILES
jgi:hypothetical protein